ncbi:MAG TPA: preprotein translocase subunit YajC [Candidatus Tetragenococcus pullicola]|nr:preprotein translocase subunit YajC [Candidatus Tetragenococcus pullicola]
MQLLIMLVPIIVMMIFMSRSQKKQQKERQNLLDSIKPGSKVVTAGGLHGVVSEVDEVAKTVTIDCEGIFLEFDRTSIRTVKPPLEDTTEVTDTTDETETLEEDTTETKED